MWEFWPPCNFDTSGADLWMSSREVLLFPLPAMSEIRNNPNLNQVNSSFSRQNHCGFGQVRASMGYVTTNYKIPSPTYNIFSRISNIRVVVNTTMMSTHLIFIVYMRHVPN